MKNEWKKEIHEKKQEMKEELKKFMILKNPYFNYSSLYFDYYL